jgi:mono/diheme cytochrome c family protein
LLKVLLVSLLVILVALTTVACSASNSSTSSVVTTTSPAITSTPAAIDAAALYAAKCAACHGANRQGTAGVAPAINKSTIGDDSDAEVAALISNGKTGTAMPAFKGQLTADQINALVTFIKAP